MGATRIVRALAFLGAVVLHTALILSFGAVQQGVKAAGSDVRNLKSSQPVVVSVLPKTRCGKEQLCNADRPLRSTDTAEPASSSAQSAPLGKSSPDTTETTEHSDFVEVHHYYKRAELSAPPFPLTEPHIRVPEEDDIRLVGAVKLRIFVSESGTVDEITVLDSSLPDDYVENVRAAFQEVKFSAGKLGQKSVKSIFEVKVDFYSELTPFNL